MIEAKILVQLEQRALALMRDQQFQAACSLWKDIVSQCPNWEHGSAYYNLACCLEDSGVLNDARSAYEQALKFNPNNPYFVGGYASFLYLHGSAAEAYSAYIRLLGIEKRSPAAIDSYLPAVQALGARLGLTDEEITTDVTRATDLG